jgi:putative phosphoesterase
VDRLLIGVIAGTHGLIRQEAFEALKDSDLVVHAGDIGTPHVLDSLRAIAPVVAMRGNIDREEWAQALPKFEIVEVAHVFLYVIHDLNELELDPGAAGFSAIISGHSHKPSIRNQKGVLMLNPGSAGPRRFNSPVSVALIYVKNGRLEPKLIELPVSAVKVGLDRVESSVSYRQP